MAKIILHTPIKDEDIKNLKIGDIVYLTGHITTCRDVAHRRLIEEKENFPLTSKAGPSSMPGRLSAPLPAKRIASKWSPLDRRLPCEWKNLKRPSSRKRASS